MELRRYVQAILRGDYAGARVEHPRLPPCDLNEFARAVHSRAARPRPFPDPRHLAVGNGLELVSRAPPGLCGEGTALGRVAFQWDPDPQVRGLRVMHGIAHAVLDGEREASDSDAWLLTGMLFVPNHRLALARANPQAAMAHAPAWMIVARMIQANLAESVAV